MSDEKTIEGLPIAAMDMPLHVELTAEEEERAEELRRGGFTYKSGCMELVMCSLRLFVRMDNGGMR